MKYKFVSQTYMHATTHATYTPRHIQPLFWLWALFFLSTVNSQATKILFNFNFQPEHSQSKIYYTLSWSIFIQKRAYSLLVKCHFFCPRGLSQTPFWTSCKLRVKLKLPVIWWLRFDCNCKAFLKMYDLYWQQEHYKASSCYYCITIMDHCDMIITLSILLHITRTCFLVTNPPVCSKFLFMCVLLWRSHMLMLNKHLYSKPSTD